MPALGAGVTEPRVVVVLGASSGIGLASALRFAELGDHLVLAARAEQSLERAADDVVAAGAASVRSQVCDVLDADTVDALIADTVAQHGRIDAVVHSATTMAYGRIEDVPAEVFASVIRTSIEGTANVARAMLPVFRRQHRGVLVIVNSLLGAVTVPNMGAYATAKWGQRALARTLQQEVRDEKHVHVCLVSPGSTNTPIYYQAANYTGRPARPPVPVLPASWLAHAISAVVARPRGHVSAPVGFTNPLIVLGFRALPAVYDALVGPLFRRIATTRGELAPTAGNVLRPRPEQDRVAGHWPDPDPGSDPLDAHPTPTDSQPATT